MATFRGSGSVESGAAFPTEAELEAAIAACLANELASAASAAAALVSAFLNRDEGPLVQGADIKTFADAVDETRDAVERLEARLELMQEAESQESEE